jgi:hypothetical protein
LRIVGRTKRAIVFRLGPGSLLLKRKANPNEHHEATSPGVP